jgi:hypothetical protein
MAKTEPNIIYIEKIEALFLRVHIELNQIRAKTPVEVEALKEMLGAVKGVENRPLYRLRRIFE